ncbi:uncharacterized protein LOC126899018 [Daktulosphaira vitifoliae]|uniref:uncharacterized protein LOC126899018 n=1 Tax=Daktulosphaira vitifoliae TaxID=58002 RepID=UPI0021AA476D|nr:uncharacterized protein LOC126899018 [Daktulosphaira vitifoliae]
MINLIINKCQSEKDINHQIQFQYCTEQLVDVIKNSTTMFMKLLGATTFLNQLDLRIIDTFLITPRVIDNEIELFYIYTDAKMNRLVFDYKNRIVDIFEDIKIFHKSIAEPTIQKLYELNMVCGFENRNEISNVLMTKYDVNNIDEQKNDPDDFVNLICNDLNTFYSQIADNYYRDLGFGELVGTNYFRYEHRKLQIYYKEDGIILFNNLLSYPGWQSYQNITTKTNGNYVNIKNFIGSIHRSNYNHVQICIIQTLRCRYFEIAQTFNSMLGASISVCEKEHENRCATILFKFLEKINIMLKNMLFALVTLRQTFQHTARRSKNTPVETLIESFIELICKLRSKYYPGMFFSSQGVIAIILFFNDIIQERKENLDNKLYAAKNYYMRYFKMPLKIIEENWFKVTFQHQIEINNSLDNRYGYMCDFLYSFCDEVQINDYEKLGFDSLPDLLKKVHIY